MTTAAMHRVLLCVVVVLGVTLSSVMAREGVSAGVSAQEQVDTDIAKAVASSQQGSELQEMEMKVMDLMAQGTSSPGRRASISRLLRALKEMKSKIEADLLLGKRQLATMESDLAERNREVAKTEYDIPLVESLSRQLEMYDDPSFGTENSRASPHRDCKEVRAFVKNATNGYYWVFGIGGDFANPFLVYCDMERAGGGWTLVLSTWYKAPDVFQNSKQVGDVRKAMDRKSEPFKLSDWVIRERLIGPGRNFDVMADQSGYNTYYSRQNNEYVVIKDYMGTWRYDKPMEASESKTIFESYRRSDNKLIWSGDLKCGTGGAGINCWEVVENNPAGGAGCRETLGTQTNDGWHHFMMGNTDSQTGLYICNGAQHSSGQNMNHRFWIRTRE